MIQHAVLLLRLTAGHDAVIPRFCGARLMDAGIPPMRRISQFVGPCEDLDLDLRLLTTIKPGVERTTELLGGGTALGEQWGARVTTLFLNCS